MDQIAPIEVGLPVIDLDNMLAFYCDVLSCEEVRRADIPPELSQAIKTSMDKLMSMAAKLGEQVYKGAEAGQAAGGPQAAAGGPQAAPDAGDAAGEEKSGTVEADYEVVDDDKDRS